VVRQDVLNHSRRSVRKSQHHKIHQRVYDITNNTYMQLCTRNTPDTYASIVYSSLADPDSRCQVVATSQVQTWRPLGINCVSAPTSANLNLTSPASKARDAPVILRNSDNCILRIAKGSAPKPRLTFNSNRLFLFVFHLIGLLDLLADQHLLFFSTQRTTPSFLHSCTGDVDCFTSTFSTLSHILHPLRCVGSFCESTRLYGFSSDPTKIWI
jgi:hypothetical protein